MAVITVSRRGMPPAATAFQIATRLNPAPGLTCCALPPPAPLQIVNPSYDYVPPELISLFVTGACCA